MVQHADIDHTGITGVGGTAAFVGAKVYHSTTQSVNDATSTALTFDTEAYDTDAFHDAGTPTRLTCPSGKDGVYLLVGGTTMAAATSPTNPTQCWWRKTLSGGGSSELPAGDSRTPSTTLPTGFFASTTVELAAGDYVELMVYQDGTGAKNFGNAVVGATSSFASITFLGT